jgi:hypothetical protein
MDRIAGFGPVDRGSIPRGFIEPGTRLRSHGGSIPRGFIHYAAILKLGSRPVLLRANAFAKSSEKSPLFAPIAWPISWS